MMMVLTWKMNGGRQRVEKESNELGKVKEVVAGKMVPNGFPRPPLF